MNCPRCNTNVDGRASFCPVCGSPLRQEGLRADMPRYHAPISQRSIPLAIVLSIVTCGIYGLYWLSCIVTDLNTAAGEPDDTGGGMVVLLGIVTCNIYMLYWFYKAAGKVNRLHQIKGEPEDGSLSILYLLLSIFGFSIVNMALIQSELNKVSSDV